MYLPRGLIAHLYQNLIKRNHAAAPPVLLLVALEPDALCACRILTALLKRDYIPHKIQPISGYGDLSRAADELVRPMRTSEGGSGGVVVCLGVGGMVDLEEILGLDVDENGEGGPGDVEVWVMDARRPWNLSNVFGAPVGPDPTTGELVRKHTGVDKGKLLQSYQSGRGGIIVFDDGDIEEEMDSERQAYCALEEMPELGDEADLDSDSDAEDEERIPDSGQAPKKRKSDWDEDDESMEEDSDDERPRQRRRSNSVCALNIVHNNKSNHSIGRFDTIITRPKTSTKRSSHNRERTRWFVRLFKIRLSRESISVTIDRSTEREVSQSAPKRTRRHAQ
jgi:cell division control protein 45